MLRHVDFAAVREGRLPYQEAIAGLDRAALENLTADSFDAIDEIVAGASDFAATMVPIDRALQAHEEPWTLARVIAHLTSTSKEAAAIASTMARGVALPGGTRLRAEVPWTQVTAADQVRRRLAESRRICLSFLETWPDPPRLDLRITLAPPFGPLDAVGVHALGLMHAADHLEQLREIIRQSMGTEETVSSSEL